ncbi:MAG: helix-turn-helix domain-containing protein [Patescibacteria group bacterium]|jgi:sugar-specific transcriptional regulator TrmB
MENQSYEKLLTDLGMRPQEAKIYLAALKLGQSTVSTIAEDAGIQRTFAYDILKDLMDKAIVSEVEIRGKKHYSAVSIEQFKKIQEEKFKRFESAMPELKVLEKTVGDRPKVRFFEGREGLKTALYDTLQQKEGSEIISYATAEGFYTKEPEFSAAYIKDRVAKKISARSIVVDTPETRKYTNKDTEQLRTSRFVPADKFPFTNEIDIYGNKVAILSTQGEIMAVIIESESIAKTQRMIFELAWIGAQYV